jgi:hypothetical protein
VRTVWQLPGPRRFVDGVVADLEQGRSVVLLLPEHGPQGYDLRAAVERRWTEGEHGRIEGFTVDPGSSPLALLAERYPLPADVRLSIQGLFESERFPGRTLWLEGMCGSAWPAWKAFLADYEHVARNQGLLMRTSFVVPLMGQIADDAPGADVGLAVHRWDDVLDGLDLLLLAGQLLRNRGHSARLRELLASTVAQVALFDVEVADRLSAEPAERILAPLPLLEDVATERGWSRDTPRCWHLGSECRVTGEPRAHSALRAINGGVERRIWRAQVGAMFPLMEEYRQSLVQKLRRHLRVPFETDFGGRVTDPGDLELGHVAHQVRRFSLPLAPADRAKLKEWVDARNALAHLEAVPAEAVIALLR